MDLFAHLALCLRSKCNVEPPWVAHVWDTAGKCCCGNMITMGEAGFKGKLIPQSQATAVTELHRVSRREYI